MITTYIHKIFSILLGLTFIAAAQSLEDKVSQSRKMQAESVLGVDPATMDSLLAERKDKTATIAAGKQKKTVDDNIILDSLLSGPMDTSSQEEDSLYYKADDSTHQGKRKRRLLKPAVKRYEQRIFGSTNRSLFSGAGGAAGRDYVLGPGDGIKVSVWGDKEKEYDLVLNQEGKIFMEGIGQVEVGGQNLDGAQQIIRQRMAKVYSGISRGSTHVGVSLGKTGPIRVFVLGEVKVPGGYIFTGHTSPLAALYFAKGPTDIGTVRNLQLTRSGNKFNIDLYQYLLRGESVSPHALQDGDIIFAARAETLVQIEGDVGRPAIYELKKGEGVKELLQFAGGLNPTAATQKLTMQRVFENGTSDFVDLASPQEYLSGKARTELRDGDRILVEKSSESARNFITVSGPVKYPGNYEASGITSVAQLIAKAGGTREDAYVERVHVVRYHPNGSSSLMAYSLDSTLTDSIPLMPRDNVILYSVKDMYMPDSVEIAGAVFNPSKFEYRKGMTVQDLIMQAGGTLPHHEKGKAIVFRGTERVPTVVQISLDLKEDPFRLSDDYPLLPNDFVHIPVDPHWYKKEIISLEGLVMHPGKYSLLYAGEKLSAVVDRAGGFKDNAYVEGGRFFRQKDSVGRVGVDIAEAMHKRKGKMNISLVGGDSIFIPERLNTVKVIGEVGFETSLLFQKGATVQYYIERAGGFTRRSERDKVVVQYANGESSRDGYFNRKPDAGSVIYVPKGPEPQPINWVNGMNILLSTMTAAITLVLLSTQLK